MMKTLPISIWIYLLIGSCFIIGCNDNNVFLSAGEQLEFDVELIKEYLSENNIDALETPSGLHYVIEEEGTGVQPTLDAEVTVRYKGYLLNGNVFDETTDSNSIMLRLNQTILGWQEGLQYFRSGSVGKLFIPSWLGYGQQRLQDIPSNSVLVFDVELLDVVTEEIRLQREIDTIQAYLTANNLTATATASGLHYIVEEEGEGDAPDANSEIVVAYTGYLLDGSVFDEVSVDQPITIPLANTIPGWEEGMPLFQKGGKGRLFIPSSLGFGEQVVRMPQKVVEANSILVYDFELIDF